MTVTLSDLIESIMGLRTIATDLRQVSTGVQVEGVAYPAVLASPTGLAESANYLDTVANELMTLVPDEKVTVPEDA